MHHVGFAGFAGAVEVAVRLLKLATENYIVVAVVAVVLDWGFSHAVAKAAVQSYMAGLSAYDELLE